MDTIEKKSLSLWQLLLYLLMIGLTFISIPKTSSTYILYIRIVQYFEVLFCIALLYQNTKQRIRLNRYNIIINSWWLFYTLITYLFALSQVGLTPFFNWMNIIVFLLLGKSYWEDNMHDSVKYLTIIFSFLIYLNAVLLILYPEGLWIDSEWIGRGDPTRYLFGNYNMIGFVCLLGILVQALYTFSTGRGQANLLLIVLISIASVAFVGSMTSTVCLTLLGVSLLLKNIISRHITLFLIIFVIIYLLFFTFIIWNGYSIDDFSSVARFIEEVLSKNTTFTNRTTIWFNAVSKIKESPLIGWGVQNTEWNDTYLGGSGPHNLWLMLLLQGGYCLCISFVAIVIYVIKHALRETNKVTTISIIGLCICFTMSLFEVYNIVQIFLLIQLVYYSRHLSIKQSN